MEAAARVFACKGFATTKISDIASAAGLSHGLIYHYFDSKAAVFGAIVDQMLCRIDEEQAVSGKTAYEKLAQTLERRRRNIERPEADNAHLLVARTLVQGSVPAEIRERVSNHMAAGYARLVERIQEAQLEGSADGELSAQELASALMMFLRGMSVRVPGMADAVPLLPSTATILRLLGFREPSGKPSQPSVERDADDCSS